MRWLGVTRELEAYLPLIEWYGVARTPVPAIGAGPHVDRAPEWRGQVAHLIGHVRQVAAGGPGHHPHIGHACKW